MVISIKIVGKEQLNQAALSTIPDKVAKESLLKMSQIAFDHVSASADKHTKTGALFQSVFNKPTASGTGREVGHDGKAAPHAIFVIFGTKPHVIKPATKKALRWPAGDGFVFARSVNHPGYAGDDYMTAAAAKALAGLQQIIAETEI